jgi:5-methylcytosine-specific restriction endonuclease McrA
MARLYNANKKLLAAHRRQGGKCALCGAPLKLADANNDHTVPRSKGGTGALGNLRAAHRTCNQAKGNRGDPFVRVAGITALRWDVKAISRVR